MNKNREIKAKDKKKMVIIVLVIVVCVTGIFLVMNHFEKLNGENTSGEVNDDILETKEKVVDGVTYKHKRKLHSYLFIGVDVNGEAVGVDSYIGGGQGDVQMILTVDDTNRTWQLLQLNRDTMTNVNVLGVTGAVVGSEFQQLCLAHSYGSGRELSCENNVQAVKDLLEDENIDGYFAMNMDGIELLNNAVGGVTVNVTSDFSKIDPDLVQGTTVKLTDKQAIEFVRSRKDVDDQTNISRMARQREFMNGLLDCIKDKDADFATEVYNKLSAYVVTDISQINMSKIFNKILTYKQKDIVTIDGEAVVEDEHWAYYLDEDSKDKAIVEMFYDEKE